MNEPSHLFEWSFSHELISLRQFDELRVFLAVNIIHHHHRKHSKFLNPNKISN